MDTESQRVYDRMRLYRLAQQHPDWKPRRYAEELGKTAKWVRTWLARIEAAQTVTLQTFLSRSRAPKHRPRQTPNKVKKVISELRVQLSERFHRRAGARLILRYLKGHRDLTGDLFVPTSPATVTRVLHELGHITPTPKYHHEPLERPAPMTEWEMDFGEIRLNEFEKLEFFVVVDCGTSRVVYLEGSDGYDAERALAAVARLFAAQGRPEKLRFDRDPRFVGSWTADSYPSALVRFLRVLGVDPAICPPRRPDRKPYVERVIGTLKSEWLARYAPVNLADALDVLDGFPHYHNRQRPHFGSACDGRIPDEAFPKLPLLPRPPTSVNPDRWLQASHGRVYRRRINTNGMITIDKHSYYVDANRAKQRVLVYVDVRSSEFVVTHEDQVLKQMPIKGLVGTALDFDTYLRRMKQEARSIEQHRRWLWMQSGELP